MNDSFLGAEFRPGWHACPECETPFYRDYVWKVTCVPCYLDNKSRRAAPPVPAQQTAQQVIPPDMLRRLLQCCHPDKHQGSESAHIATRWLLALKSEGRVMTL